MRALPLGMHSQSVVVTIIFFRIATLYVCWITVCLFDHLAFLDCFDLEVKLTRLIYYYVTANKG